MRIICNYLGNTLKFKKIIRGDRVIVMPKTFSANTVTDFSWRSFAPNETIPMEQGYLWLIRRGITKTVTWDKEGKLTILGYWGARDIVGLSQIEPYEIRCLTFVEASCIPQHQWTILNKSIFSYVRQMEELFCILRCEPMQERLWQVLTFLGKKFGHQVTEGKLIDLRLTHQEIADVIGSTRVTVTRLLHQLEEEGKLDRSRRHLLILRDESPTSLPTGVRGRNLRAL
jgi:CRP-like cAMP-binding protein